MRFFTSLSAAWLAVCALGVDAQDGEFKKISLRTHSLMPPYLDSDMQSRWWDFGGDTIVRADQHVRLTPDRPSREGWIFSRVPLTATNWEIELTFKIHGAGNLHGDGMAMWITRQRAQTGPVFGSVDQFEGLGIFFDTYKNNRPGTVFPYVMAMVGDGQTPYDQANDGKSNEYAGCSARGIRGAQIPTKARLTYIQDKQLKLELQYKTEDVWVPCFDKTDNVPSIPSVAYLGFSAHTGELSDNFDIINVNTQTLYSMTDGKIDQARARNREQNRPYQGEGKSGGWLWFFFKVFMFFGVCGGAYVGYTVYRTQNKRSHRF